jgi:hypothetical protein
VACDRPWWEGRELLKLPRQRALSIERDDSIELRIAFSVRSSGAETASEERSRLAYGARVEPRFFDCPPRNVDIVGGVWRRAAYKHDQPMQTCVGRLPMEPDNCYH